MNQYERTRIERYSPVSLSETILLALSRDPKTPDHPETRKLEDGPPLANLIEAYPDFVEIIQGKKVADFGSGKGINTIEMKRAGAAEVIGIEINPEGLDNARALASRAGLEVTFVEAPEDKHRHSFDVVISENSMEHFSDPESILRQLVELVAPGGILLITFGPPWYAPYGGHMRFFTRVPWVHLLFSEATIMRVRRRFRDDGATRYEEVVGGLNRMSVKRFEQMISKEHLVEVYRRYDGVRGAGWLTMLPLLRELFTVKLTGAYRKPG
jgi:SAM-dependent methyltransferase